MCFIFLLCTLRTSANISLEEKFSIELRCYKTIVSYISCAFIEIWSTWEVWRALKKLELLSATPWATLMHLLCSPNFLRASYLDEHTLTYEPIVKLLVNRIIWKTTGKKSIFINYQQFMFEPVLSSAVWSGHPVLSTQFSESQNFFFFFFFSTLIFTSIKRSPLLTFNSQDLISNSPYSWLPQVRK